MKWDSLNITCCKDKWGLQNRGVTWDTLVARWARRGGRLDAKVENESSKKAYMVPTCVSKDLVFQMIEPPTVDEIEFVVARQNNQSSIRSMVKRSKKVSHLAVATFGMVETRRRPGPKDW